VSLTQLDQTAMEFFNPSNAFDAEGLTRLTEQIERRKKIRNDIEQDTMIQIRNKNLETEKHRARDRSRRRACAAAQERISRSRARRSAPSLPRTREKEQEPRALRSSAAGVRRGGAHRSRTALEQQASKERE
jgi:uncharacterized membrane protein YqiK